MRFPWDPVPSKGSSSQFLTNSLLTTGSFASTFFSKPKLTEILLNVLASFSVLPAGIQKIASKSSFFEWKYPTLTWVLPILPGPHIAKVLRPEDEVFR
jgi:hypothetical protein